MERRKEKKKRKGEDIRPGEMNGQQNNRTPHPRVIIGPVRNDGTY